VRHGGGKDSSWKMHFWAFSGHVPTGAIEGASFEAIAENGHERHRWKEERNWRLTVCAWNLVAHGAG
jgi:hypothetical protein